MKRRRYFPHLMKARMEPKVIKEEISSDKECTSYLETPPNTSIRTRSSKVLATVDRCRSPDSPEGATTVTSPTQSSPTPPLPSSTAATLNTSHGGGGGTQQQQQQQGNNGNTSPISIHLMMRSSGSNVLSVAAEGTSPPPPGGTGSEMMVPSVITTGSPTSMPLALTTTNNNPRTSTSGSPPSLGSSASEPHVVAAAAVTSCGSYAAPITRPLVKVRRFLSTLVQFGMDIHVDIGERVRSLVLSLVSSNLSIEEFHHSLQDVTNFPLRPFVLPFLRAHLPILQREIHAMARNNKQSALHYVRTHEHVILDSANSPAEVSEIFLSTTAVNEGMSLGVTGGAHPAAGVKRKSADTISENGCQSIQDGQDYSLPAKRQAYLQHNLLVPQALAPTTNFFDYQTNPNVHNYSNQQRPMDDFTSTNNHGHLTQNSQQQRRGDEEWRNIHVMLNCILSMVEKTKRALTILQQRNGQDLAGEWLLRRQDVSGDLRKVAQDILVHAVRQTEERVNEVRKRAEEAVSEVRRQAVAELQKAVAIAEGKANELLKVEKGKMENILTDSRKYPEDSANSQDTNDIRTVSPNNGQSLPQSQQNHCWNCGRKAHETCSGCNIARYCGPFCQHKDWETHHQTCPSREPNHHHSISSTITANHIAAQKTLINPQHSNTRSLTPTLNSNNRDCTMGSTSQVSVAVTNNGNNGHGSSGNGGPLNLDKHNGSK